jgi:hypothetical protein
MEDNMNTKVKKITQAFLLASIFFTSTQQCFAGPWWDYFGSCLGQVCNPLQWPQFWTADTNCLLQADQEVLGRTAKVEAKYQQGKIDQINAFQSKIQKKVDGDGIFFPTPGLDPKKDARQIATLDRVSSALEEAKQEAEKIKQFVGDKANEAAHDSIAAHGVQRQEQAEYLTRFTRLKRQGTEKLNQCLRGVAKSSPEAADFQTRLSHDTQETAKLAGNMESQKFATRLFLQTTFANPWLKAGGVIVGTGLTFAGLYKLYPITAAKSSSTSSSDNRRTNPNSRRCSTNLAIC